MVGRAIQIKLGIQVRVGFYMYKWKSGFRFCVYVQLKNYKIKPSYFIVRKVSHKKFLHVSTERASSGKVINYNKEGMIKMGKACLICKQIKYPSVGRSISQYFCEILYVKSGILKTWNSENCKTLSSIGLFLIS